MGGKEAQILSLEWNDVDLIYYTGEFKLSKSVLGSHRNFFKQKNDSQTSVLGKFFWASVED